jgi:hypothetical protein
MMIFRALSRFAALGLLSAGLLGAQAGPSAAADCASIGRQMAAESGGKLIQASESNQGGRPVCVVMILLPAKDGQPPRRDRQVIPLD